MYGNGRHCMSRVYAGCLSVAGKRLACLAWFSRVSSTLVFPVGFMQTNTIINCCTCMRYASLHCNSHSYHSAVENCKCHTDPSMDSRLTRISLLTLHLLDHTKYIHQIKSINKVWTQVSFLGVFLIFMEYDLMLCLNTKCLDNITKEESKSWVYKCQLWHTGTDMIN